MFIIELLLNCSYYVYDKIIDSFDSLIQLEGY
jgi:hypothetical protein